MTVRKKVTKKKAVRKKAAVRKKTGTKKKVAKKRAVRKKAPVKKPLTLPSGVGNVDDHIQCCGVKEYNGVNDSYFTPEKAICRMAKDGGFHRRTSDREGLSFAHILMTERHIRGDKSPHRLLDFEKYVKEHGLGTFIMTDSAVNPNSRNTLTSALFTPDPDAMKKWLKDRGYPRVRATTYTRNAY